MDITAFVFIKRMTRLFEGLKNPSYYAKTRDHPPYKHMFGLLVFVLVFLIRFITTWHCLDIRAWRPASDE